MRVYPPRHPRSSFVTNAALSGRLTFRLSDHTRPGVLVAQRGAEGRGGPFSPFPGRGRMGISVVPEVATLGLVPGTTTRAVPMLGPKVLGVITSAEATRHPMPHVPIIDGGNQNPAPTTREREHGREHFPNPPHRPIAGG